jgi:hypothetical protein
MAGVGTMARAKIGVRNTHCIESGTIEVRVAHLNRAAFNAMGITKTTLDTLRVERFLIVGYLCGRFLDADHNGVQARGVVWGKQFAQFAANVLC